jgi:Carbohydrate binding module (family 35)
VVSTTSLTGYGKAGIIVRNDMTGSGSSPEGVILFASPSGGIQLEWDSNGGDNITSVTPPNETIPESTPVWLELVRNGSSYTGYYSYDGSEQSCPTCSGGDKVGVVGEGGTLTFTGVTVVSAGTYNVTIAYCDGSATGRPATISVNGGTPQDLTFTPSGSFSTVGTMTVPLQLSAGTNTIEFADPSAYTPDLDRIIVADSPGQRMMATSVRTADPRS